MKSGLLSISLLLIFIGCEFPMEDENFVELSDTPKNKIVIDLMQLPDTVEVFQDIHVSYSLDVEGYPAIAIFLQVGNEVQYLGYDYTGDLHVRALTDQIQTKGYLPFEFAVFSTTRTGSLADRSQRELMVFSVKRVLYFDYTPVKPINFTKVEDKNGSVFLYWDKYPEKNLIGMWIEKTITNNGNTMTEYFDARGDSTYYQDTEFIGTDVEYSLITETTLNDRTQGAKVKISATPSKIIEFNTVAPNQLLLKWNKAHFYSNARAYQLNKYSMFVNPFYTTSNSSDTTYTLKDLPFGEDHDLFLTTTSRKLSNIVIQNNTIEKTTVWMGKKKPVFKNLVYNKSNEAFFFLNSPYLVREKNGVRDSVDINIDDTKPNCISANGQSIFVSSDDKIIEVSTTSLATQHTITNSDTFTSMLTYQNSIVAVKHPDNEYPFFNVYNRSTGALIQTFPLTDVPGEPSNKVIARISNTTLPDYFIGDGGGRFGGHVGLFKFASDGTIESAKFAPGSAAMVNEDAQFIYVFDNHYRYKYTFPQFEKVDGAEDVLPIHSSNFLYDTNKGLIAMVYSNNVTIVDAETLTVRKTLKITTRPANYTLSNGVLFVIVDEGGTYAYDLGL